MDNFKKIIVFLILFFTFYNVNSYSEVVNNVEVQGNNRISSETIMIFGDIVIGNNYEESDVGLLIKKLYETNYFSNISVELNNGNLIVTVEENPIINSVNFEGEKASKYKDKIEELLTLRVNTSFIKTSVKPDVNRIKEFYRYLGFYFVKIDVEIEKLDNNRVNLVYQIDKGKKAKISKIFFLGDKKIRDRNLRDIITTQEARFWKFISRNVYLNQSRIELDKRLLLNYYKNKALYKHVSFLSENRCLINNKIFFEEAGEIIFKSFSDILSLVSGTYYPPRSKKILNLINRLKKTKFTKSTLGGCIIEKKDSTIVIYKESKVKKMLLHAEK